MNILNYSIEQLFYNNKNVREKLKELNINTVRELCEVSRKELNERGIEPCYIKDIIIALQCNGLDLKKSNKKK